MELGSIGIGLVLWYVVGEYFSAGLIPTPIVVAETLWHLYQTGVLMSDVGYSVMRVVIGFLVGYTLALPVGFITGWFRLANKAAEPYLQFLRTIPALALIPLLIVYLGIGEIAKIALITYGVFLTVAIIVHQGVMSVDENLVRAARVLGAAKNSQIFRYIVVPSSLPYLVVSARLGLAGGWTLVIAAELIAANHGLGHLIEDASTFFILPEIYGGIFAIGVLGLAMDRLVLLLSRRLGRWQDVRMR
jgi:NitT/TauT family transport system permease protein